MNLLVAKEEQLLGEPPEARCAVLGTQPAPNSEKGGDSALGRRNPAHIAEITYTESSIHLESAPQKVGKRTDSLAHSAPLELCSTPWN